MKAARGPIMTDILPSDKILISGATGSLGREVIAEMLRNGQTPVALVREHSDTTELDRHGIEMRVADLRDQEALRTAFRGIALAIHAAAWISFRQDRRTQFTGINTFGAIDFYKAARAAGVRRVVHISTVGAIGAAVRIPGDENSGELITEEYRYNLGHLRIPYLMSKAAAEHELIALAAADAPELVILNPTPILTDFPPGDLKNRLNKQLRRIILPRFDNLLSLVDVRDCAPAVVAALSRGRPGHRYILAGDPVRFDELLLKIGGLLEVKPRLVRLPRWILLLAAGAAAAWTRGSSNIPFYPDLVRLTDYDWGYSSERAKTELGFAPRPLDESLRDLLQTGFQVW